MVVQVAVSKESQDDSVGLMLQQENGAVVVGSISPDSLFANTRLHVGMEVLSINQVQPSGASNAMKLLRDAQDVIEVMAVEGTTVPPKRPAADPDSGGTSFRNQEGTMLVAPGGSDDLEPIRPTTSGRPSYKPDPDGQSSNQFSRESQKHHARPESNHHQQEHRPPRDPTMVSVPSPPKEHQPSVPITTQAHSGRDPTMIQKETSKELDVDDFEEESFVTQATPVWDNYQVTSVPVAAISTEDNMDTNNARIATVNATAAPPRNTTRNDSTGGGGYGMTIRATKPFQSAPVGIQMRSAGAGIVVDKIQYDSIFQGTPLRPGMKIQSINGCDCTSMSTETADILFTTSTSDVTIVAVETELKESPTFQKDNEIISVTVTKPSQDAKVGIGMRRIEGIGFVVDSIAPTSLFAPTELKKGMKLLSINDAPVQANMSSQQVLTLLSQALSKVTIVAEKLSLEDSTTKTTPTSTSPVVTVTATKPTRNAKVGIAMKRHEGVGFLVEAIAPMSLFANTELKQGMKILSINGIRIQWDMQSQQVLSLLVNAESDVTITAEPVNNMPRVSASAAPPLPAEVATPRPMVSVTAPSDLMEGYQFDAMVNGRNFKVTVPPGGVKAGQQFQVPYPTEEDFQQYQTTTAGSSNNNYNAQSGSTGDAPTGHFKNELFSCFETCPCPFLMGWCCTGILAGQVLQRLKLNAIGMPGNSEYTCVIMTALFVVFYFVTIIVFAAGSVGYLTYAIFYIYLVVALTLARNNFRQRYNIPGSACGDSPLDDCCCAYWCSCCTVIQMHRHTHDEQVYAYDISSKTGLPPEAPEIV